MKFLIDNQLPFGLVAHLQARGLDSVHVANCGLASSADQMIWDYAKANNLTVITKDEDFVYLSGQDEASVAIVWVRLGNCRNNAIFGAFDSVLDQLVEALAAGSKIIELR